MMQARNSSHCNIMPSLEVFYIFLIISVTCYPLSKDDQNTVENLNNKNEKTLPNGTVVGQYTYADNDGNPIHVKYYADDASYGVELKSVKVIESNLEEPAKENKQYYLKTESPLKIPDLLNSNYPLLTNNYKTDFDIPKANQGKTSDYEIYYQKQLKEGAKRCHDDNIRVYYDKEKRRLRNTINANDYETVKYCDQM